MSGTSEVLQEYLVKLGFKVDQGDLKKFNDSIGLVSKGVLGVGLAVAGVVAGVEAAAASFAYSMRKVYFDSQLAQSSVKNLQSLEYAGKQVGISAEAMGSAIHNMAQQLRLNPGMKGLIESFGIKVEGRDVSDVMTDYVKALGSMPEFQAAQFAGMFGMDPDTYHQMREHIDEIISKQKAMKQAYADMGVDMDAAAKQSMHYADTIDDLKMHFEGLATVVLSKTAPAFDWLAVHVKASMEELAKAVNKNGLLSTIGDKMLGMTPFPMYKTAWNWLTGGSDKPGTTAAQRSTGVLPVPGGPTAPANGAANATPAARIAALEKQAGLPPGMLWRVYGIESAYGANPGTSSAGALGPFQFMPETGAQFGMKTDADRMDFDKSSAGAARYLSRLMAKYGGNQDMALAAYNWGPGNVDKYGIANLNPETKGYLDKYHALEGATINNTFNITGNNATDIANKVAGSQSRTYADALRNGQGVVR